MKYSEFINDREKRETETETEREMTTGSRDVCFCVVSGDFGQLPGKMEMRRERGIIMYKFPNSLIIMMTTVSIHYVSY